MIVEFDKSFFKSLDKVSNTVVLKGIEKMMMQIEKAGKISDIATLKSYQDLKIIIESD